MKALITGITGQDGSYLAEFLLSKGYEVHGIIRRSSSFNTERLEDIYKDPHESGNNLHLHYGDLLDGDSLRRIVSEVSPDEIYNLAAMSHVKVSFEMPVYTSAVNAGGTLTLLEIIKEVCPKCRFYQASTSELFGASPAPQNETTPFLPQSPYAVSKLAAHNYVKLYREAYGLHASCGILFNHESERRKETFVTRKITRAVGRISQGLQDKLYLFNTDSIRDWGHSKDYVRAMWMMLGQDTPDDYVIGTGESHSVQELVEFAFDYVGLNWIDYLEIDPKYKRPLDVPDLRSDPTKAREKLGWTPEISFEKLITEMLENDIKLAKHEKKVIEWEKNLDK